MVAAVADHLLQHCLCSVGRLFQQIQWDILSSETREDVVGLLIARDETILKYAHVNWERQIEKT